MLGRPTAFARPTKLLRASVVNAKTRQSKSFAVAKLQTRTWESFLLPVIIDIFFFRLPKKESDSYQHRNQAYYDDCKRAAGHVSQ
mmetsp:Transcript_39826/g.83366  ORF Transcript_39826/g.83366 Transcript_39826/m.83366 type:complete len:85 (-) Transcript_39826:177-431(-)